MKKRPHHFETITLLFNVLSTGGSGSLCQHAADNKMVYNPQEHLIFFPALHFPKNGAVPRVSGFPLAIHQSAHYS
jgi:hypothetical protein